MSRVIFSMMLVAIVGLAIFTLTYSVAVGLGKAGWDECERRARVWQRSGQGQCPFRGTYSEKGGQIHCTYHHAAKYLEPDCEAREDV